MKRVLLLLALLIALGSPTAAQASDAQVSIAHPNKLCAPVIREYAVCIVKPRSSMIGIRSMFFGARWKHWGKRAIGFGKVNESASAGQPGSGLATTRAKIVFKKLRRCPSGIWKYTWRSVYYGPGYREKLWRGGVDVDCDQTWYLVGR
ncbi:MAG TPA: hypothetical protein VMF31_03235 [Solirubrobacterales bacterium]|nr:hypothetical protein [Solirubrobacterales bacterium]